jgi:SagB-type dehydrogenase family enzyme
MSSTSMWTSLGSPVPRPEPATYSPWQWPMIRSIPLPQAAPVLSRWPDALAERRSRRTFAPVKLEDVSTLLWNTLHCQRTAQSPMGFDLQQRPIPSGGAIHPVHLVIQVPGQPGEWARYNPLAHSLDVIGPRAGILDALVGAAEELIAFHPGSLLIFVAEPAMTAAKYENANSVVWRDAGVMQGALAIAAEGLGLNYCLLGITGDPWVGQLSEQCQLVGVGLAALGARP